MAIPSMRAEPRPETEDKKEGMSGFCQRLVWRVISKKP